MKTLKVAIGEPTSLGRLYPSYDEESGILAMESRVAREWPFGVDVDGRIVFDLDANRVLASMDVNVPKAYWRTGSMPRWPRKTLRGDLLFAPDTIKVKSFSLPLEVRCDERRQYAHLKLGSREADTFVELSRNCVALLKDDALIGFLARDFGAWRPPDGSFRLSRTTAPLSTRPAPASKPGRR